MGKRFLIFRIINMKKIAVVLVSLLFAACASTPKPSSQTSENSAPQASTVTTASVSPSELESKKLADEIQAIEQQSIYFDLDKSAIKSEYKDVLQKQADFIKANKNDIVTIQGNCDERGSPEYNLALGEKRADAARKDLEILGVPASQIKTVSFGMEKPRLTCHEEKCWKENRRDDFVHTLN
jgi:peptidoglycan-associated lipoprotein